MLNNIIEMNDNTRKVFNLYSTMNEWMDFMISVQPADYKRATELGQQYLFNWHDEDTDEPIGNYLQRRYKADGIEAEIYELIQED